MLKVENISKKFLKQNKDKTVEEFLADNNISFSADKGKIIGILGPNGAGKTTLLRMLAGILQPTSGKITFDGLSYDKNEIEIKKKLAYLSGNTKIYNSLSPYELFKMCGEFYEVPENECEKRIKAISKELNMDDFLYNKIEKLSTGQTQRVNIGRCLLHNPDYYIFDEATSGLDIIASQIILDFIKKEKEKSKTIIYSTHYMEEAENICDEVLLINKGNIIKQGSPKEINSSLNTSNLREAFFKLIKEDSNNA
ncbi:MAG: ABC transporter ATP-binding protein [Clostridia bacterium]|nr:ABC transporter ATP-binding protein [Clostridia bacterium]